MLATFIIFGSFEIEEFILKNIYELCVRKKRRHLEIVDYLSFFSDYLNRNEEKKKAQQKMRLLRNEHKHCDRLNC